MSNSFLSKVVCVSVASGLGALVHGQSVSAVLNLPAQRDAVISAGNDFLIAREKPIVSDKGAPDPFIGKVEDVVEEVPTVKAPVIKAVINEAELLQNLGNRMSARGTAIMGEDRYLLLSQKRLKVGESITINFDEKDYEVWLSEVTSTTFTIKRNGLTYTRAVLLAR